MSGSDCDVLQEITDLDLVKLKELYRNGPYQMYNYLSTVIRWTNLKPGTKYFTIFVPQKTWITTGTFIGIYKPYCYEMVMCTLEEDGRELYNVITHTKKFSWNEPWLIYELPARLYEVVMSALERTPYEHSYSKYCNIYWLPQEIVEDLVIECPDDVYISRLNPEHAKIVNQYWPPRFIGSEHYFANFLELNVAYGMFLKSNNQLVSWVVQKTMCLGSAYTIDSHKNKGYVRLVTKCCAKTIVKEDCHPLATVFEGNKPAECSLMRIGFKEAGTAYFIYNRQMMELGTRDQLLFQKKSL